MLMRSSRSPIFNEIGDLVTVIFDRHGRTLAQTEYASIIANGAQPPLRHIMRAFEGDLADGDVILHNDVYTGGNQNADVGVFVPVFHDGALVGWTASKGHVADIGGMTAGGYDPNAREVWQEAFRIPPLKLYDAGVLRRDVWELVRANIRLDIVTEDIKSMIGACTIGKRRLLDVLQRYGVGVVERHMDYVIDASERQARAEIARWPDGEYRRRELDGLGRPGPDGAVPDRSADHDRRVRHHLRLLGLRRPGTRLHEHAARLRHRAVRIAFLMLLTAAGIDVPTNHGLFAPIRTVFREGSLLQPAVPRRHDLREPDVRRGPRGDHPGARPCPP